ncbi:MAG: hypothetical protein AAF197_03875 [Pseudomonadota bacterium]
MSLNCLKLPGYPAPLLLPNECIAETISEPDLSSIKVGNAIWMRGYVPWNGDEIPLMSFDYLANSDFEEPEAKPIIAILNPIPKTARRTYGALLCFGESEQVVVEPETETTNIPNELDRRYCEMAINHDNTICVIPKLSALGVAFGYF